MVNGTLTHQITGSSLSQSTGEGNRLKYSGGFSAVEVLLGSVILGMLVTSMVGAILFGEEGSALAGARNRAALLAEGGLEAVRNIRDAAFSNLSNGTFGLTTTGNIWNLSGSSDSSDIFTRSQTISTATSSAEAKDVVSVVSWQQNMQRTGDVTLFTRLTNWRAAAGSKPGMLVFADGGTTTDAIKYQTFDGVSTWSTAAATADVDGATTNKVLQVVKVYASETRNEKVMIGRHYDGTSQYIYGQVYNGLNWGNVQLLTSWAATTFLDVRNFDATYMANGDLMVVYSDNTVIPKMRTWNGSVWSAQSSLTTLGTGQIPSFVRIAARPNTNEVMAVFFTQALDALSEYWSGSAWSVVTSHSTNAFNANDQGADFAWNMNTTTIGAIIFMTAANDRTPRAKLFQADGVGGGTWQTAVTGAVVATAHRSMEIESRNLGNEFQACFKDTATAPDITCRKLTFVGTTGTWATPTNPILTANAVNNTMQNFGFGFETLTDNQAVVVYSDNTNVPKLKKYAVSTSTWDSAATSISTTPFTLGSPIESARVYPISGSDDLMVMLTDSNLDLYSLMWDGTNNLVYTTPAAKAFLQHGTSGSAVTNYWYDFAWDNF